MRDVRRIMAHSPNDDSFTIVAIVSPNLPIARSSQSAPPNSPP